MFTLDKTQRLKSRKRIEDLFRSGKGINNFPLRLAYIENKRPELPLQAGFSVSSRKFRRAADRNRIKRLMKEAYRLNRHSLEPVLTAKGIFMDCFFIYTGKTIPEYKEVEEAMKSILIKFSAAI